MEKQRDLILFVDDQSVARKYFSLMFSAEYEVLTASNAQEAWGLVRRHEDRLAVIVTDQRMPNLSGVDLLMAVRRTHPRIIRLLTTGHADLEEAIDAVNRGEIYAYIHKPWNIEEFGLDLRRAVGLFHLQEERDSLLGLHSSAQRHALYTDRLYHYGLIAATCSGWIEGSLGATLAFWSDSMRHFIRSVPRMAKPWGDVHDQTSRLMASATEIGTWLAANLSDSGRAPVDAAAVARKTAEDFGVITAQPPVAVLIPLDQHLFEAGLRSLFQFLAMSVARTDAALSSNLVLVESATGGLDLVLRIHGDEGVAPRDPYDPIEAERLGLQAYLAIHHHGGSIALREWKAGGGVLMIHLPSCQPASHRDATARFLAVTGRR